MIKKLRVTVDGKSYDVTVEVPDEPGQSTPSSPAPASATPPAASAPAPVSAPTAPAASHASAGPGDVRSPLAGRIVAIVAQPGQQVKEGDHLLTVEAMKMNTTVNSPKAGKVEEILTTVGAAVDEGQVLARVV